MPDVVGKPRFGILDTHDLIWATPSLIQAQKQQRTTGQELSHTKKAVMKLLVAPRSTLRHSGCDSDEDIGCDRLMPAGWGALS